MTARLSGVLAILGCLATALLAAQPPQPPASDRSSEARRLIDELDVLIQDRFADVDQRFGMSRIVEPGDVHHTLRRFQPEDDREVLAVRAIERAGLDVALYLAGRSLLDHGPSPATAPRLVRRAMAGPVLISRGATDRIRPDEFPAFSQLTEHGRRAFDAFSGSDAYRFALGQWQFEARPVRASRSQCLECHRGRASSGPAPRTAPRVGDALGVVLYGYSVIPCRLCS